MEVRLRTRLWSFIAGICLFIAATFPVYANIEDKLGIRFYGSFLYTDKVPNALFFFSDIKKNDSFELRKALRNHDIDILVLSSKGGSVWEGLNMAGIIFDKELITYVPKLGLDDEGNCASACAFMFFGGSTRIADGKLGVHQFYSGTASESAKIGTTQKVAQFTVSEIIGFLNEFNTPPFVYERMFQQSEMYYFDDKELEQIVRENKPLEQDIKGNISRFIDDFKIELAALEEEGQQETKTKKKVEPKILPKPKKEKPVVTEKTEEPKPSVTTLEAPKKQDGIEFKERVRSFQKELNKRNCNAGAEDGVPGPKTRKAVELFLKTYELIPLDTDYKEIYFQKELLEIIKSSDIKCPKKNSPKIVEAPSETIDVLVCSEPVRQVNSKVEVIKIYNFTKRNKKSSHKVEFCLPNNNCSKEEFGWWVPVGEPKQFVQTSTPMNGRIFIGRKNKSLRWINQLSFRSSVAVSLNNCVLKSN